MDYKKRCEDCACLIEKNGVWTCDECFGQKCSDIDDCPYGNDTEKEIKEMTEKAKEITRYEKSATERKKATRERKVDTDKLAILEILEKALTENGYCATIEKEVAIHFDNYTLKLTRHRSKK